MNNRNYITAQSWNGTWFYYNRSCDTWVMADNAVLDWDFDCVEDNLSDARECAVREKFAAINISLNPEVEASI